MFEYPFTVLNMWVSSITCLSLSHAHVVYMIAWLERQNFSHARDISNYN